MGKKGTDPRNFVRHWRRLWHRTNTASRMPMPVLLGQKKYQCETGNLDIDQNRLLSEQHHYQC